MVKSVVAVVVVFDGVVVSMVIIAVDLLLVGVVAVAVRTMILSGR